MNIRCRLPDPDDFKFGFWRSLWYRLSIWRRTYDLNALMDCVRAADIHNHDICVEHINEIDSIHNYLGENIKPDMPAEKLVEFASEVQYGWSHDSSLYPWKDYE